VVTAGVAKIWTQTGDSGNVMAFFFCADCGSDVWYHSRPHHDAVAVPLGCFDDPFAFTPCFSVWEVRRNPWVTVEGDAIAHYD
jgi:hypothetical protein